MPHPRISGLPALARLYGVQTSYFDVKGNRRTAMPEGLLGVLRALGAPVEAPGDVPAALSEQRRRLWQNPVEPVLVAWNGILPAIDLRLPEKEYPRTLRVRLSLEHSETRVGDLTLGLAKRVRREEIEGTRYFMSRCALPKKLAGALPAGYHRLTLECGSRTAEVLVISAPVQAYHPSPKARRRSWGVFLPLYALHSRRSWGAGDLADLQNLMDWTSSLGGSVVATLPLLATFLTEPYDPSPYAPASRLFWNELYLDLDKIPELPRCARARALLASAPLLRGRDALRASPLVDYRRQVALKRRVLEELARSLLEAPSQRRSAFRRFAAEHRAAEDYARFRATCEARRAPWQDWPERLRNGRLRPGDYAERSKIYHLYSQWVAQEQLASLSAHARRSGEGLYLDLPLGVHANGYDVWRERASFLAGASGGAPPDPVFTKGQDWGFAPLHPHGIRTDAYRYVIAYLRHHMQHARVLRIDHVMGLQRLYVIPQGMEATQGAYVRYREEELYAILSVESHRHRTWLIGENLGTVPSRINAALARHRIHSMYVVQYELALRGRRVLRPVPRRAVASLNTHDMPPFAAYWKGLDVKDRLERGLLDRPAAKKEQLERAKLYRALGRFLHAKKLIPSRSPTTQQLYKGCVAYAATSASPLVLLNLEDLWLETEPQNVPDSKETRANWVKKARYSLEAMRKASTVLDLLRRTHQLRVQKRWPSSRV